MTGNRLYGSLTVLLLATIANAGAVIELVPSNPGPYFGGESLDVDVELLLDGSFGHYYRLFQIDTTDTHEAVELIAPFRWRFFPPLLWNTRDNFPRPTATYIFSVPPPCKGDLCGSTRPLHLGTILLRLPMDAGGYLLDLMNREETNATRGAVVLSGFGILPGDDITIWRANTGELRGGSLELVVVPEPMTLGLVALGFSGMAVFRRRATSA